MAHDPRITGPTLKVLALLMASAGQKEGLSGAHIAKQTKLATGTLYPILMRLEQASWLESEWEEGVPEELGRPRRRFYRVTPLGAKKAVSFMRELPAKFGDVAWA